MPDRAADPEPSEPVDGESTTAASLPAATSAARRGALRHGAVVPSDWLTQSIVPQFQAVLDAREQLGRYVSGYAVSAGLMEAVRQSARFGELFSQPLLSVMATASRAAIGDSMLTANLAANWANLHVFDVIKPLDLPGIQAALLPQLDALKHVSELVEQHNSVLARLRPLVEVARPVVLATRAWQDVVRMTPEDTTGRYIERLTVAGRGTGWAVQAGIALTEVDETRVAELEARASVALGPATASADLRLRLTEVHPSLRDRLDGAWERIHQGGNDAASQAANSLMELVDWTLRLLAPDAGVLVWHETEGRPMKELYDGRPTRALRLRFAVRQNPEKNSALNLYLRALGELVNAVQAPKHGLDMSSERALVPVALAVEGLLHFMLVD